MGLWRYTMRIAVCMLAAWALPMATAHAQDCAGLGQGERIGAEQMPSVELRDRVFACAGLAEALAKEQLDQLDLDFVFMRARSYDNQRFLDAKTETEHPRRYSDFISETQLDRLRGYIEQITGADQ